MRLFSTAWTRTVIAAGVFGAIWLLAASNGYALETIWLPPMVIGAAWPASPRKACVRWLRRTRT
jgi:hypothetical protein